MRRSTSRLNRPGHPASFWITAAVLVAMLVAAGAPSPLYVVYQAEWHFNSVTLTTVFGVYVATLLLAVLCTGALSDRIGRRPVIMAALLVQLVAMALFAVAGQVGWLYAARAVQGLATGMATGALSAALLDLAPVRRPRLAPTLTAVSPLAGLGLGAVGAGALVQYGPAPTRLIYLILLVVFAAALAVVAVMPEPAARPHPGRPDPAGPASSGPARSGPASSGLGWSGLGRSLRPRVRVPEAARPGFLRAVPALVASWALPGLYLSLGPSIAAGVLGSTDHLVAGTLILVLNGVAALAVLVVGERDQRRLIIGGGLVLVAGVVLMLVALATGSTPLLFVATGLAGAGGGPTFLGAFRSGVAAAPADERGALIAALYLVSYLAFSLPAVLAGAAVRSAGLRVTATWYGLAVVVLALLAVAAAVRSGRSAGSVPQESTADVTAPAGSTPSG